MNISYKKAKLEDIECIYAFNKQLIDEYNVIYVDGKKAGYYHFFKNEEELFEIDDLYVFIQNERAISLYKRLGFEVVETIKDSRYIMRKI